MGAGQNQVGGPVHGGFTETFERPFQVRHALVEFRLARFKPVHVALNPIHAPGDNSPPDQDQAGKSDSNARLRFWNDIPGRIIPVSSWNTEIQAPDSLRAASRRLRTLP